MSGRRYSFMVSTILASALASPAAWGQNVVPAAENSDIGSDIVVTAQKRSERLQDVPMAVSAVSADTLLERNQTRVTDYFASIPSLNATSQGNGQTNISIRGVTTGQSTNPAVGIVIDDVPYGASTVLGYASRILPDLDPAALARIEVLRGPQGTLYGASSIGGLLKFVTREPSTSEIDGRVQADINSVAHGEVGYGLRGSLNLPLSDTLAVRASGFYRRDGGYIDNRTTGENDVNGADAFGGHFIGLWKPSETVSLKVAALLQNIEGDGTAEVDGNYLLQPTIGNYTQTRIADTGDYKIKVRLYSATVNVDLGGVDLTSITGYGINLYTGILDASPQRGASAFTHFGVRNAATSNYFRTKKFSQEVRLASSGSNTIDWLVGGFYTKEDTSAVQIANAIDQNSGVVAGNLFTVVFPTTLREIAGFADATIHFTDKFDIQLGGRYSENRQTYEETDTGALYPGNNFVSARSDDNAFTFLVTPRYRFSSTLMAYARVASGYRVGGPNAGAAMGFPATYGSDTTINYEVGLKGSTSDRLFSYDLSAFYVDWKDIQIAARDPVSGFLYFLNGNAASSKGIEASLTLRPSKGLTIAANGALNDAQLDADMPIGGGAGFKGDRLPLSSRFTGSVTIDQEFTVSDSIDGFVGATVAHVGSRLAEFTRDTTLVRMKYPEYTTFDLRAGLKTAQWSANLFVSNLTDKRGIVGGSSRLSTTTFAAPYAISYIRPRTVGLSLARNF